MPGGKRMFINHILRIFVTIVLFYLSPYFLQAKSNKPRTPRLTVIFIIDQFAYHYIPKLKHHFHYGLEELFRKGIVYTEAYHAHGVPETTTGHHAISTGTLPKDHGGILNQWIDKDYQKVAYDEDKNPTAEVFQTVPATTFCGKSPKNTMVDGLSDQFVLQSAPHQQHYVFSLSLKSYPAIATANRMGKAIWLDDVEGNFTSSKKYFSQLPSWLVQFNKEHKLPTLSHVSWKTIYSLDSAAYDFPFIQNYDYAGYSFSMVSKKLVPIDHKAQKPYDLYMKTPHASQTLIALAKTCVDQNFKKASDRMLVWICLSNLDLVGHMYGPDALETIDTIYHVDRQIKEFMDFAQRRVGQNNCLFVLTADHGIPPIPEITNLRGISFAQRIMAKPLIENINQFIGKKYHAQEIIKAFEPTYFVLNKKELAKRSTDDQKNIINDIKNFLKSQSGIKQVWTAEELKNTTFAPTDLENFYKTQLYNGRSGDIICMPEPYCLITHYPTGTSHLSPYAYDTHVPLVVYQKGQFQKKTIEQKVWIPQLPVTLAYILGVARPSASTYPLLPEICT